MDIRNVIEPWVPFTGRVCLPDEGFLRGVVDNSDPLRCNGAPSAVDGQVPLDLEYDNTDSDGDVSFSDPLLVRPFRMLDSRSVG